MERTSGIKRVRRVVFVSVLGILIASGIVINWPRERLLTSVGRPVIQVDNTREQICWQSNHQLLLLRTEHDETSNGVYGGPPATKDWRGSADLFNTDTGARTRLSGLTDLLNRVGVFPRIGPESFTSPDGTWFLWRSYENGFRGDNSPPPRVASLDGSHFRTWRHSENEQDFYLDAQHLVQMRDHEPVMTVYDLLDPAKDRTYAKLEQAKAVLEQHAAKHPVFICLFPFCSDRTEGCTEIHTYRTQDYSQLIWAAGHEGEDSPELLKTQELRLPGAPILYQQKVAPQQTALLHYLQVTRSHPLRVWLHRILPSIALKPTVTEELWVSRPDGQGMHVLGYVPPKLNADGSVHDYHEDQTGALSNLQWLPDGKQVSFRYEGTLYVVQAEAERP